MATAIARGEPFSGELIRLYEEDENRPSLDARAALGKVFERSEIYIEFGVMVDAPAEAEFTIHERALIDRYRLADARWQLSLRLLAALATEDQIEVASDVNVVIARILGMKPKDLRYPSDKEVAKKIGPLPSKLPHLHKREFNDKRALVGKSHKKKAEG